MGYLDNTSITVDAILTMKGRELLARNDGSFNITQFALGDDEIDYTLFNENHPNGTQYAAEAIENMPLIEAIPNGQNMLLSKLITLSRNTSAIPNITTNFTSGISIRKGQAVTIEPTTYNLQGTNQAGQESGYIFTIINAQYQDVFAVNQSQPLSANGSIQAREAAKYFSVPTTKVVGPGGSLRLRATTNNALFSTTLTSVSTSIIVEGADTGAKVTIPFTITTT
tara:strand:+ start:482 stop:1156 length:675 start_codon:yes stop_codon:yes gene_type:complete